MLRDLFRNPFFGLHQNLAMNQDNIPKKFNKGFKKLEKNQGYLTRQSLYNYGLTKKS